MRAPDATVVAVLAALACAALTPACSYDFTLGPPPGDAGAGPSTSSDAGGSRVTCDSASCTCSASQTCTITCWMSSCTSRCLAGSTCDVDCVAGGCTTSCAAGSSCSVGCLGGRCSMSCEAGASCAFAHCEGGGCTCTGEGCP